MKNSTPTIIVLFGATGDLVQRKIVPALFDLQCRGELPARFQVVGFSRRELSDEAFRESLRDSLQEQGADKKTAAEHFLKLFSYQRGNFDDVAEYRALGEKLASIDRQWQTCANKLFYLAVPPPLYELIFKNLAASGLTIPCGGDEGWTRVIVEKPFGHDAASARQLDATLAKLFREEQIYRIDHYLAKEMMQNILTFRFGNNLFETTWGRESIESITVRFWETLNVEDRGGFYDGVGALRDVGQNHLLQMLALTTLENPQSMDADILRRNRAAVLEALQPLAAKKDIVAQTFRAQYDGYRQAKGVAADSQTETYFRLKTFLDLPRWRDVPIILESGKSLNKVCKEIEVTFKHPSPCLCPPGVHYKNSLVFGLEPKEGITIRFWSKKPGLTTEMEERTFDFQFRDVDSLVKAGSGYERLLRDCIAGDQTLFVSSQEIAASWKFIDPIIAAWEKNSVPLHRYQSGSAEIVTRASTALSSVDVADKPFKQKKPLKKEIGVIGLGKMGAGIALQLKEKGWLVHGFDPYLAPGAAPELKSIAQPSLKDLLQSLPVPRLIWLMIPAGAPVEEALFGKQGLVSLLDRGDIIIDGGNSFYEDSVRRSQKLVKRGIHFMDVGVSGGPSGARHGASLMIGGSPKLFENLEPLFRDLSLPDGYSYMGSAGAGHFVKMVHNGIEYGMMQAIAEGFAIMKKSPFKLDLQAVAEIYNHGSVIESRLVAWLEKAFAELGIDLQAASGSVAMNGEGEWTLQAAKKLNIPAPVIAASVAFRRASQKNPSYTGKILSAIRNQFGGHVLQAQEARTSKKKTIKKR